MNTRQILKYAAIAVGGYFLGRLLYRQGRSLIATRQAKSKTPIRKNLRTILDFEGNYDIDGVSYDTEGVIIASDDLKGLMLPH